MRVYVDSACVVCSQLSYINKRILCIPYGSYLFCCLCRKDLSLDRVIGIALDWGAVGWHWHACGASYLNAMASCERAALQSFCLHTRCVLPIC